MELEHVAAAAAAAAAAGAVSTVKRRQKSNVYIIIEWNGIWCMWCMCCAALVMWWRVVHQFLCFRVKGNTALADAHMAPLQRRLHI